MQLGLRVPVFSYTWVLLQDISDLIPGYRELYNPRISFNKDA